MRSPSYRIFFILSVLLLTLRANAGAAADQPVGYAQMTVRGYTASRGAPSNKLSVVVWYPAAAGTAVQPIAVGPPQAPLFVEGLGAENAPLAPASARRPFIVVSHGTGGTTMDLSWLCAGLAARGYIVASVDHAGNNALETQTVAGNTLWWLRAQDLSRVIDGVLAEPRYRDQIDPARIGAAGFSLGGYTVLVIAGARGNPYALDPYCAKKPATPVCTDEGTPAVPNLIARSHAMATSDKGYLHELNENLKSHRDVRVKAVFSIAPALGPAIVAASLNDITIPIALVAGIGDPILPVSDNAIPDALAIPNAELTLLPKSVGHYTFLMDCAAAGKAQIPPICSDAGPERLALHERTVDLAASFFARTL